MNFAVDTFESIARRKRLAGWLFTLRGPPKKIHPIYSTNYIINWAELFNNQADLSGQLLQHHLGCLIQGTYPRHP